MMEQVELLGIPEIHINKALQQGIQEHERVTVPQVTPIQPAVVPHHTVPQPDHQEEAVPTLVEVHGQEVGINS